MSDGTRVTRRVLQDASVSYGGQRYTAPVLLSHVGQTLAVRVVDSHARPARLEVGYPADGAAQWVPLAPLLPQGWPAERRAAA